MYSIGITTDILEVCIKTLRKWEAKGKINCVHTVGRHRRFPTHEIQRLLGEIKGGIFIGTKKIYSISEVKDMICF